MQKNQDLLKLAIWVFSGVLLGALITVGVQQMISPHDHKQASAQSETSGETAASTNAVSDSPAAETAAVPAAVSAATPAPASSTGNPAFGSGYASPNAASDALAVLNAAPQAANASQVNPAALPPNTSLSQTTSGYPIYTGSRAVDSPPAEIPAPPPAPIQYQQMPDGQLVQVMAPAQPELAPQAVGRNGLLANPCADPYSAHGLAYSRSRHYN